MNNFGHSFLNKTFYDGTNLINNKKYFICSLCKIIVFQFLNTSFPNLYISCGFNFNIKIVNSAPVILNITCHEMIIKNIIE